ncbi:hypothetical protein M422DRAFT_265970 [Sphaerobolus stellatus SS14]|uniref:Uncharacterized protein n=1 Tax=Sphaerobolus stellatus (strain SS14) TaxID=990650 RepID=A0A0C9V466_SPHS4|nr:hypothetical protein M422DRAFT_265970 [Sphaerobolus stellatus SS14]
MATVLETAGPAAVEPSTTLMSSLAAESSLLSETASSTGDIGPQHPSPASGDAPAASGQAPPAIPPPSNGHYEPPTWDFEPFVAINRHYMYSLHPYAIKYLESRLPDYYKVEGPQGVPMSVYERHLASLRLTWKQNTANKLMAHFPGYDYKKLLPPNPSQEQLKAAEHRVLTKIDNMLAHKEIHEDGFDITSIFHCVRKVAPKDLWAKEDPAYTKLETDELRARNIDPVIDRKKNFPEIMKVRTALFAKLSDTEQMVWKDKAKAAKNVVPESADIVPVLPKLFALIGDTVASKTGWYVEIRAAGLGMDKTPHYFVEKYIPTKEGIALDYTDIKGSDEYDNAFRVCVSKAHKIEIGALRRLQPWKPKVPAVDFKCPAVELRNVVDHDAEGNISTLVDRLLLVLTHHAEFFDGACCTEWADVPSTWVDIKCLPPAPFELISPMLMKPKQLLEFGSHIICGELGLIEPEVHFRWLGQVDGPLTIPPRQRTAPKPDAEDGEEIVLDDVSASDTEAEEAKDSKTTRKHKAVKRC